MPFGNMTVQIPSTLLGHVHLSHTREHNLQIDCPSQIVLGACPCYVSREAPATSQEVIKGSPLQTKLIASLHWTTAFYKLQPSTKMRVFTLSAYWPAMAEKRFAKKFEQQADLNLLRSSPLPPVLKGLLRTLLASLVYLHPTSSQTHGHPQNCCSSGTLCDHLHCPS